MSQSRALLIAVIAVVAVVLPASSAECPVRTHEEADPHAAALRTTKLIEKQGADVAWTRRRAVAPARNLIDEEIFGAMFSAGIAPAPACTDAEFLRRASLDLTGQIPTVAEVESFLADPRRNKREILVDRLLTSETYADRWALFFGDLLRNTVPYFMITGNSIGSRNAFHQYLRAAVREGRPYDQLARGIITATGAEPPVAFLNREFVYTDPEQDTFDNLAVSTHRAFLGINVFCISCHSGAGHTHLFSPWLTQRRRSEFWESAAFFAQITFHPSNQTFAVYDDSRRQYELGTTSGNKAPRNPSLAGGREVIDPVFILTGEKPAPGENRRAALARMMTTHPQFARAAVNHLWKQMFVVGIVEPADAFDPLRQSAPAPAPWSVQPSHPRLLDRLAQYFRDSGYDIRAVLRLMATSQAYQLSASYGEGWRDEYAPYYARRLVRRLSAEEMLDGISSATDVWIPLPVRDGAGDTSTPSVIAVKRAGELPDVTEPARYIDGETASFLEFFKRGNRVEQPRSQELSLQQMLTLLNAPLVVTARVEASTSRGHNLVRRGDSPKQIVRELYLATLGRPPDTVELRDASAPIEQASGEARIAAVEDLQWALVNSLEFILNH